jgi:hypothetical protein
MTRAVGDVDKPFMLIIDVAGVAKTGDPNVKVGRAHDNYSGKRNCPSRLEGSPFANG